jgi:hypothetical protein
MRDKSLLYDIKDKGIATVRVAGGRGGFIGKKCDMMVIIT